jgi:hypothetical protein
MYPVEYPTACSPQAWSTGAPLLLLRTMLGLEPMGDHLGVDPVLPKEIGHLALLDIPGRWGHIDAFGRGRVDVSPRTAVHCRTRSKTRVCRDLPLFGFGPASCRPVSWSGASGFEGVSWRLFRGGGGALGWAGNRRRPHRRRLSASPLDWWGRHPSCSSARWGVAAVVAAGHRFGDGDRHVCWVSRRGPPVRSRCTPQRHRGTAAPRPTGHPPRRSRSPDGERRLIVAPGRRPRPGRPGDLSPPRQTRRGRPARRAPGVRCRTRTSGHERTAAAGSAGPT